MGPDGEKVTFADPWARACNRIDEYEADQHAALYLVRSGYKFSEGVRMLRILGAHPDVQDSDEEHPSWSDRAAALAKLEGSLREAIEEFDAGVAELRLASGRTGRLRVWTGMASRVSRIVCDLQASSWALSSSIVSAPAGRAVKRKAASANVYFILYPEA